MRILQLCKKFPYPLKDGEAIAITHLSKALCELGCELTLLSMNTKKHYFDIRTLPKSFNHYKAIYFSDIDNELKAKDAFLNLFSSDSYHISRFVSTDFEQQLIYLLQENEYDVVQLETLYLAPYIPTIRKYSKAKVAMRAHNVEHEIWQRIAENASFGPRKWYLSHLTKKLKNFELAQLQNYDVLVSITQRDLDIYKNFGYENTSVVTPIGIDNSDYLANDASYQEALSISFIGSLDWMPNLEGLKWFLENSWPAIVEKYPDIKLHIAGRNTPDWMYKMNSKNLKVYGEIPVAVDFINKHSIMLVPLLSGSGMRAKILEGMALGKVVISTKLGLEGIDAKHQKEVLVADSASDFMDCIQYCYQQNGELLRIGQRAQVFVAREYDNLEIARRLLVTYQKIKVKAIS